MRKLASAGFSFLAVAVSVFASAQVPVQQLTYRGFSVVRQSDLEPALNRYAVTGYRLAAISTAASGNVIVLMDQLPPESAVREYRVIFGGWAHLRGLHNESPAAEQMNEAGAQGFRFVPGSVVFESGAAAAVVMEKDPDPSARYDYRIFSPQLETSHRFQQDALQGQQEGFHVVFHGHAGRGASTLMEKRTDAPASAQPDLESNRFLSVSGKDMRKRLQQQLDEGYVAMRSSVWMDIGIIQIPLWLQKAHGSDLLLVTHEAEFARRDGNADACAGEFVSKLNDAAARGYRMIAPPVRIAWVKPAFRVHPMASFNAVMQRSPGTTRIAYRYLPGTSLPELVSGLNEAATDGFHLVPDTLGRDGSLLMERVQPASSGGGAQ